jgi:Carbohydrate binding domain
VNASRPRHPWAPVAAVLLALLLPPALSLPAEANLLPNAGFEELEATTACPRGWQPWATPNTAVYSLAAARSGTACAAISDHSAQVSQGLRSSGVGIRPGQTYEASVWLYIERLEAGGFSVYLEFWSGETRIADYAVSTEVVGRWTELRLARPAPANAEAATVLIYGSSATVGRALFDDACLESRGQASAAEGASTVLPRQ